MQEKSNIRAATAAVITEYLLHLPEPKTAPLCIKLEIVYGEATEQHKIEGRRSAV